ncbi:TPA: hypothetical protein KCH45_003186 [Escherichia coli]|nr:hypothetical protein [Escherichia coli]EME7516457.1 hypothetical protein [Salmonella enterica]HBB7571444.1 hypothetical protein [Escherichia coli]HDT3468313.1 hypothetical protein [Escherichia coli]HDX3912481.1 hypothetical protein [Enterobacter kobei]
MTKILTTAEHNQARADLATLTAIVENYAVTHPKKHGWSTLGALCMPAVFVLAVGYPIMTDIDSLTGAVFSLIGCVMLYGAVGAAGYLQGEWHNDELDMSDLHKIRAFSPFVKQLVTNGMAKNNGLLTYTLLESLLCEIEFALKEDDLRFNINKQLNV